MIKLVIKWNNGLTECQEFGDMQEAENWLSQAETRCLMHGIYVVDKNYIYNEK